MEIALKTNKLCKSFSAGGVQQHVLKNMDIELYQGDFTVIMGPSGGGKSTLLYALSGMDTPSLGSVLYSGERNLSEMNQNELAEFRSRNCGFVFQQIYLVDSMTVLDNVLISGLLSDKDKKRVLSNAKAVLKKVNITEDCYKKFPNQLSGGEAQRVGVARAVVGSPKIIFADEPTGALNSQNAKAILDILTDFNAGGQSIVMVTHDIISALRADRILYLRDGHIEGELRLQKYEGSEKDIGSRKNEIKSFLNGLGW